MAPDPWEIFGEGPNYAEGDEQNRRRVTYTGGNIRFTTKGNSLYAVLMEWLGKNITIKSLPLDKKVWFGKIKEVRMLGYDAPLKWT
jgi:alpha-L-fucosidase